MPLRSLILALVLLWSNFASAQTTLSTPTLSQPSASGDIVAFRLQNTSTSTALAAGWTTQGQVFKPGQLPNTHGIRLRVCSGTNCSAGTYIYAQIDVLSSNSDGSVRHAAISYKTTASIPANTTGSHPVASGSEQEFMINDCASSCPTAPSPVAPDNTAIAAGSGLTGSDVSVGLCYTTNCAPTYTETIGCQSIMAASNAAGTTKTWLNGPAVKGYIAHAAINGNAGASDGAGGKKLKVTCVWYAYADSGAHDVDVIFDNTWAWKGGKSDPLLYSAAVGGTVASTNLNHYLYSDWDREHYASGVLARVEDGGPLNVVYDASYLNETGAWAPHDLTVGVQYASTSCVSYAAPCSIVDDLNNIALCGSAAPVTPLCNNGAPNSQGYGIWDLGWNAGGGPGRNLASDPSDYFYYVLTGDPSARVVMMNLSRAGGSVPWHQTDETCSPDCLSWGGLTINTSVITGSSLWPPGLANGNPCMGGTPCPSGNWWGGGPDWWAHPSDFNSMPFMFSAKYFDLRELQYTANHINYWQPNFYSIGGYSTGGEQRRNAWGLKIMERAAYITPDSYPLKSYWTTEVANNLNYQLQLYRDLDITHHHGMLRFHIHSPGNGSGSISGFQGSYMVSALYDLAIKGMSTVSAQAHSMLNISKASRAAMLVNHQLGMLVNDAAIYYMVINNNTGPGDTEYGCSPNCEPAGLPNLKPKDIEDTNSVSPCTCTSGCHGYFTSTSSGGAMCHAWSGFFADASDPVGGMGHEEWYLIGQLASEFKDPFDYEAWAYAATLQTIYNYGYTGNADATVMMKKVQGAPAKFMAPRLPNGHYLTWNHAQVDLAPYTNKTVTCAAGDALLSGYQLDQLPGNTVTLVGCAGSTDIMLGSQYGSTIFKPGTGNSYMICPVSAAGTCTFWGNTGSNWMRGNTGFNTGSDVYCYVVGAAPSSGPCSGVSSQGTSGTDTVLGFNPAKDTLAVKSNGSTCTSAATVVSACMTQNGDDTQLVINGKTINLIGIRDKSALQSAIVML
jgi:hypothetical protein